MSTTDICPLDRMHQRHISGSSGAGRQLHRFRSLVAAVGGHTVGSDVGHESIGDAKSSLAVMFEAVWDL